MSDNENQNNSDSKNHNKDISAGAASTSSLLVFLLLSLACSYAAIEGYFSNYNIYVRIIYYIIYILAVIITIGSFGAALGAYNYKFWKSGTTYASQLVMISWIPILFSNPENTQEIAWNEPQIIWATFSSVIGVLCLLRNIVKTNFIFGIMLTTIQICFIIPFALASIVMVFALKEMLSKQK